MTVLRPGSGLVTLPLRTTILHVLMVCCCFVGLIIPCRVAAQGFGTQLSTTQNYGKLPLTFEANDGQTDPRVQFVSRGQGYTLFLSSGEAILALAASGGCGPVEKAPRHGRGLASRPAATSVVTLRLLGANPNVQASPEEELATKSNYFIGKDTKRWRTNVANYGKVRYRQVYPGIDLVYYGNQGQLEHDFVVSPGADPSRISFRLRGARKLHVDNAGDLVIGVKQGKLRLRRPKIYEGIGAELRTIEGRYVLRPNNSIGFDIAQFDNRKTLIIDPVLSYSTYLGGTYVGYGYVGDQGNGIAVDAYGNAYITGSTPSADFPTANALQGASLAPAGTATAFVAKLKSDGSALLYSTYLGGSGGDSGNGIAVDSSGNAYVTGSTSSTDFPVVTPLQAHLGGTKSNAFVAKLSADGSTLLYSTYLGGSGGLFGGDSSNGIAVDSTGNAYVVGTTNSANFPTVNPIQYDLRASRGNAFVAKLSAAGSALVYSTYLGGSGGEYDGDSGNGIAVDFAGNAYVTGATSSMDFPTANAIQNSLLAPNGSAFVAKLKADGSALLYSTYLGGSFYDGATGIAVDSSGNAYVTGHTRSADFPTVNPIQGFRGSSANDNAFVTKLKSDGSALLYSTYLGGSGNWIADYGSAIAVDAAGNAYVAGYTGSTDFPLVNPIQGELVGLNGNVFVAKLNADGSALLYSTYLGGTGRFNKTVSGDFAQAIAVDLYGNAYITGITASTDFPTINPIQPTNRQMQNAFVAKLDGSVNQVATPVFSKAAGTYVGSISVGITDATPGGAIYYTTDGSTPTTSSIPYTGPIVISRTTTLKAVAVASNYVQSWIATRTFTIQLPSPTFSPPAGTYVMPQSVTISENASGASIYYTVDGSTPTTASIAYSGPIAISRTTTIKAIAAGTDYVQSSVATALFQAQVPAPTLSPTPGTYASPQSVTISDAMSGAAIYYTSDGSTPTIYSGPYTGAINVSSTTTVKAIAVVSGYANSAVSTGAYVIATATVTSLATSPNATTYGSPVTVVATVSPAAATGIVVFKDGVNSIGTANLNGSGQATLTLTTLLAGAHTITAAYGGDSNFAGSTSSAVEQVVNRAHLAVAAENKVKVYGDADPTATATISGFVNNETRVVVSGTPTFAVTGTAGTGRPVGSYVITPGIGTLAASNYDFPAELFVAGTLTVAPAATSTIVTTTLVSTSSDATFKFSATVRPQFSIPPTGTVDFFDGTTKLGTGTIDGSVASYTTTSPQLSSPTTGAPVTHSITAQYNGDANFQTSSGSTVLTLAPNVAGSAGQTINPISMDLGNPIGNASQTFALSCFVSDSNGQTVQGSTCTVNPATTTLPKTSVQITIAMARTGAVAISVTNDRRGIQSYASWLGLPVIMSLGLTMPARNRRKLLGRRPLRSLGLLVIFYVFVTTLACGGGGTGDQPIPPASNYVVPVTASFADSQGTHVFTIGSIPLTIR